MELSNLETLFDEARKLTGHSEYVVVGSLSALGIVRGGDVPPRMLLSIDVDCFTQQDRPGPGRGEQGKVSAKDCRTAPTMAAT